jgi:hypothetical protein
MLPAAFAAASASNAALVAGSAGLGSGSTGVVVVEVVVLVVEVVVVVVLVLVVLVLVVVVVVEVDVDVVGRRAAVVDVDNWSPASAAAQDTRSSDETMMPTHHVTRRGPASTMARVPAGTPRPPDSIRCTCSVAADKT